MEAAAAAGSSSVAFVAQIGVANVSYVLPPGNQSAPVTVLVGLFSGGCPGRSFVRQSWARVLRPDEFRLWFLASVPPSPAPSDVWQERAKHGDLLLFDALREAYSAAGIYSSLPLKSLTFYWAAAHHASFAYLLKTDDDVFVNLPGVRSILALAPRRRAYMGYMYRNIRPDRRWKSKYRDRVWRTNMTAGMVELARSYERARNGSAHDKALVAALSTDEEPPYPDYADGVGELLSSDVAQCIARLLPWYTIPSPIADVVTGHAVSLCRVRARSWLTATREQLSLWNETLPQEEMLFAWHPGRSIAVAPWRQRRNRVRFVLVSH